MYSDKELLELLLEDESEYLERKRELTSDSKDAIKSIICAMANNISRNDRHGVIIIGQGDDGVVCGVKLTDKIRRSIVDLWRDGSITPPPTVIMRELTYNDFTVIFLIVFPSKTTPVKFDGRAYVKTSSSVRLASDNDVHYLMEKAESNVTFDLSELRSATVLDLDKSVFYSEYLPRAIPPEVLAANNRTYEEHLLSVGFISSRGFPTVAGMLTIGKQIRHFLPMAYIQFLKIEGNKITDPIVDQREIFGPFTILFTHLDLLLDVHNKRGIDLSKPRAVQLYDYPLTALKELVRNAILHRTYRDSNAPVKVYWYQDRIEISNPGGPYGNVTIEDFGRTSKTDYRNPKLAEVLKNLDQIQRFGYGISISREELQKNGNPDLEFNVEVNHVMVTLLKRKELPK